MTESETKRIPDETLDNAISVYKTVIKAVEKNPDSDYSTILDKVTVELLEELKAYRAIGTVEQLEWCKDASHWKSLYKEKLEQYEAIGTIERFRELTEKAEPKKPIPNRPLQEGAYIKWTCPNCGKVRWSGYYHPPLTFDRVCTNCLQAIDWE